MEKSANKKWKESGTTLTFKEWIDRENKKKESKNFMQLDGNSQLVQDTLNQAIQQSEDAIKPDIRTTEDKSKFLGLDKRIVLFSTLLIVGSLGFYFYKKKKK